MIRAQEQNRSGRTRVALLGCGNVGGEVAAHLLACCAHVQLVSILVRDPLRDRGVPRELIATDPDEIFSQRPQLVIECIGGLHPAHALVRRSLEHAIPVVTANKTLIAHHGRELAQIARCTGAHLAYEASVCAGLPVLGALRRLRGDRVLKIQGVVNGTCNAILTCMESGKSQRDALIEAQRLGFAEADPSADLSGRDSVEKLCILAAAAGISRRVRPADVACQGIERITPDDLAEARSARRVVRLVAELDLASGAMRVGPALLPREHPLAGLHGPENGIVITAELAGQLFFRGPGAGPRPTASAVLSDVARLLHRRLRPRCERPVSRQDAARHYVRVAAQRVDAGPVLSSLARHGATATEVAFTRSRASALISLDEAAARACARDLASPAGDSLVMPLLT